MIYWYLQKTKNTFELCFSSSESVKKLVWLVIVELKNIVGMW